MVYIQSGMSTLYTRCYKHWQWTCNCLRLQLCHSFRCNHAMDLRTRIAPPLAAIAGGLGAILRALRVLSKQHNRVR